VSSARIEYLQSLPREFLHSILRVLRYELCVVMWG
jgi:hypothetical protein